MCFICNLQLNTALNEKHSTLTIIWTAESVTLTSEVRGRAHGGIQIKYSTFSQTHKIGNIDIIANFVFPYFYSFLFVDNKWY